MFILVVLVLLVVVIIIIAYRLRDLPGDGDPLVLFMARLLGLLVALLHLLFGADLVRDLVTLLPGLIYTLLLPHILAVIRVLDPLHVIALTLPLFLAYLLPHLGAFLLMNLLTLKNESWFKTRPIADKVVVVTHHFFSCRPSLLLVLSLALGHPLGHALGGLPLLVLVLIHVMVLSPALRPMMSAPMTMFSWSCSSEAQSSGDENNVGEVKHLVKSKDVSVFRRVFEI